VKNAAVFDSFLYQGQICMSTERFVVDEKVADEFVAKFVARTRSVGRRRRPASGRELCRRTDDPLIMLRSQRRSA
jgi:acyl-CoA reductase-like NAD-dependent aldehyde dehydrogenase